MRNITVDLLAYRDIKLWTPNIGDIIFKDGFFFRWCAVVSGIKDYNINLIKSGNIHLLVSGDYKNVIIDYRQIKSARYGVYMIVRDGTYYV